MVINLFIFIKFINFVLFSPGKTKFSMASCFFTITLIHNSRASRLVVDTGMHALGWSRDRAVAFMADNTAASQQNIQAEIDRYITWPGQVWSLC